MKIFFDNVDFGSSSGPNSFASKLALSLKNLGHEISYDEPDVQVSFIQTNKKLASTILRLDGIYFNTEQNWETMNVPIKQSYVDAEHVVVQSIFNKKLVFKYFGERDDVSIVRNGTSLDMINKIPAAKIKDHDRDKIWLCASSWRPHKRLNENIRYFHDHAPADAVLLIAGNNAPGEINDPRITVLGNLNWVQLISVMKASSIFLHLAWLDHCPNVVIDARATGCHIVCSSSGGTEEIVGLNSTVIEEKQWDFSPTALYRPPIMDFSTARQGMDYGHDIAIDSVCGQYLKIFKTIQGEGRA